MRTLLWLPWAVAFLLVGCENRRPTEEAGEPSRTAAVVPALSTDTSNRASAPLPPVLPLDTEVAATWTHLQSALRRHDAAQFNQLDDTPYWACGWWRKATRAWLSRG